MKNNSQMDPNKEVNLKLLKIKNKEWRMSEKEVNQMQTIYPKFPISLFPIPMQCAEEYEEKLPLPCNSDQYKTYSPSCIPVRPNSLKRSLKSINMIILKDLPVSATSPTHHFSLVDLHLTSWTTDPEEVP